MDEEGWVALPPEEQWEEYDNLHAAYHELEAETKKLEANCGMLIDCLFSFANLLVMGNKFLRRKSTMLDMIGRLRFVGTSALAAMPDALRLAQQSRTDSAFDALVTQLEGDPEFNKGNE